MGGAAGMSPGLSLALSPVSEGDFHLALLSPHSTSAGVCRWLSPLRRRLRHPMGCPPLLGHSRAFCRHSP